MSLIDVVDVEKSFGDTKVLRGISMTIERGEVVAIIGKSGSGKSTFLRCINGLETIDGGEITVNGSKVTQHEADLRQLRLDAGMIFQQFNLFPHLTVGRNVMLAQRVVKKAWQAEAEAVARNMLLVVDLEDKFDQYPDQLSGGQQQRVAIARALAMRPLALLCDEITSALDPELVAEVLSVVRGLAQNGMTLIMVTHEMAFARDVCDRVVFMHQGKIWEEGTPDRIFKNPQTSELQQFLGLTERV